MKILIDDGMQIQLGTGIGNYSLELYQNLKKYCQSTLDVDLISFERKHKSKLLDRLEYIKYINSDEYLRKTEEYDVIHYTNYLLPFKRHEGTKYVVTIHDLVAFLYPETLNFLYRYYNQFSIKYSIKKADKILTDSYSVKNDILKFWPVVMYLTAFHLLSLLKLQCAFLCYQSHFQHKVHCCVDQEHV